MFKRDPVIIMAYGGYANDKEIHLHARVLEDEGLHANANNNIFQNVANFFKRLESDEKKKAPVRVTWSGTSIELISDKEGYVTYDGPHGMDLGEGEEKIEVTFELLSENEVTYKTSSVILKPSNDAPFAVISDMDDTVIHTGVSSTLKWRLMVNSIFRDSHKRLPLEGAAPFYQRLSSEKGAVPFFYLSNSPWNLYDYLSAFLKTHKFPEGVLILKDIGFPKFGKKDFTNENKYRTIIKILETYPLLSFVLVGDAAELDTDIYLSIAASYPDRVKAIYIRAVTTTKRMKRVKKLIEEQTDINIRLIQDSKEAIDFAQLDELIH